MQCRFLRYLEFQLPLLKDTFSLDVKFGLRSVGLLLLNHVKKIRFIWGTSLKFSFLLFMNQNSACLSMPFQRHPNRWCCFEGAVPLFLAGGSWRGNVNNIVQMGLFLLTVCGVVGFFFFFLPSASASVLWLFSVWGWIACGCNWILINSHLTCHRLKLCYYKTVLLYSWSNCSDVHFDGWYPNDHSAGY